MYRVALEQPYKIGSKEWEKDKAADKICRHLLEVVGGGAAVDASVHAHECFATGQTYSDWKAEQLAAEQKAKEEEEAATLLQSLQRQKVAQKEVKAKRAKKNRGKKK